jgi:hypothetical protein
VLFLHHQRQCPPDSVDGARLQNIEFYPSLMQLIAYGF